MINLAADVEWTLHKLESQAAQTPFEITSSLESWKAVPVPGTVAQAIGERSALAEDLDDFDWVYCAELKIIEGKVIPSLIFSGLATVAEVWINGVCYLQSNNMFVEHHVDLSVIANDEIHLCLIFRSLNRTLQEKRPRPRWKTNLIDNQQLRWVRTTLLGHIPGWTPPIKAVGPWRDVSFFSADLQLLSSNLRSRLDDVTVGLLTLDVRFLSWSPNSAIKARLELQNKFYPLAVTQTDQANEYHIAESVRIENPQLWWPHTHGEPHQYDYKIIVTIDERDHCVKAGKLGFRQIEVSRDNEKVEFLINGISVFCRGACWTTPDIMSLSTDKSGYVDLLSLARDAGANMLRVGGTMVYEHDNFYEVCDELGLLVWQDFMFANMDYPFDEKGFADSVNVEIQQQVNRLTQFSCVVAFCGGSEVQQQAAMFGLPPEAWVSDFFDRELANQVDKTDSQLGYFPSSPCEGALPFHNDKGIAHYFGVGAYQRDFTDLMVADVKFATECLAFANFPGEDSRKKFFGSPNPQPHHPNWKKGVCRDNGAGWDFADVTDFYLEKVFNINAYELRYENLERYHQLSEWVTGYVMSRVYQYWRSSLSNCRGGIIWFYNDIVPGAGWGLVDKARQGKPVLQMLSHAWQSVQVLLVEKGLNGVQLEVINESASIVDGVCAINLVGVDGEVIYSHETTVTASARSRICLNVDEMLSGFHDLTQSYRFGPARHAVIAASFLSTSRKVVSQVAIVQKPLVSLTPAMLDLEASIVVDEDTYSLSLKVKRMLLGASINVKNVKPKVQRQDFLPNIEYRIPLDGVESGTKYRMSLEGINGNATATVVAP